jgi:hypothetical protein
MSELVYTMSPDDAIWTNIGRYCEKFLQEILEHLQEEVVRVNAPDNHLTLRVPDMCWNEIFNGRHLSRQQRRDVSKVALELKRMCQSHNMSLVDGEGQEINAYVSEPPQT